MMGPMAGGTGLDRRTSQSKVYGSAGLSRPATASSTMPSRSGPEAASIVSTNFIAAYLRSGPTPQRLTRK